MTRLLRYFNDCDLAAMNISKLLEPLPPWFRRHSLVKGLLVAFPGSHDQRIWFNGGAEAYVDLRDPEVRTVFLRRSFEPDFFDIAGAVMSEGGTFFDCGANFGLCTFGLIHRMEPAIQRRLFCHLFEANPNLMRYLEKTIRLYPSLSIKVVEGCVSDRSGTSQFWVTPEFTGHSHVSLEGTTTVPNIILDEYIEQNRIERINLLKMDLEGTELNAVSGLTRALHRGLVEVIYLEVRSELLGRYQVRHGQLVERLSESGFQVFYCRQRDLDGRRLVDIQFMGRGSSQLRLAKFDDSAGPLETDLLAIHQTHIKKLASLR
jgi:FkbM family methyltransferase